MKIELTQIAQMLSDHLRIGTGIDFHSLHDGQSLVLGGVHIPFDKGFKVKRSDGDPVSHAIVDALLAALNQGDIADWFSDKDDVTQASSIKYLSELREKLLKPQGAVVINLQVVILAEQPKLKPFFPQMQENIANRLKIDLSRVSIQGKTFEGKGIIGEKQGIEAHAIVAILRETTSG